MKKKLPDTPWHMGYTKKEESDPRRHKSRCIYIQDGICKCGRKGFYLQKCGGSAHCTHYSEQSDDIEEKIEKDNIDIAVRNNLRKKVSQTLEVLTYRGRKYYKIYLSECEAFMIPYKQNMTRKELDSYIRQYKKNRSK